MCWPPVQVWWTCARSSSVKWTSPFTPAKVQIQRKCLQSTARTSWVSRLRQVSCNMSNKRRQKWIKIILRPSFSTFVHFCCLIGPFRHFVCAFQLICARGDHQGGLALLNKKLAVLACRFDLRIVGECLKYREYATFAMHLYFSLIMCKFCNEVWKTASKLPWVCTTSGLSFN